MQSDTETRDVLVGLVVFLGVCLFIAMVSPNYVVSNDTGSYIEESGFRDYQ